MGDKVGIQKISNGDEGERFTIVFIDSERIGRNGYSRSTTSSMTEADVREFFEKGGQPQADVESMFALARQAFDREPKSN